MHFLKESGFLEDRQKDWDQFKYLVKHKKDVYQSGRELGVSPIQLLKHDWTKFKPSNWVPYRNFWFGQDGAYQKGDRSKVDSNLRKPFREAVTRHFRSEKHHLHKHPDEAKRVDLEKVPLPIRKEMISDWHSVAKRTSDDPQKFPGIKDWAEQNNLDWMYKSGSIRGKYLSTKKYLNRTYDNLRKNDYRTFVDKSGNPVRKELQGNKKPNRLHEKIRNIHLQKIKKDGGPNPYQDVPKDVFEMYKKQDKNKKRLDIAIKGLASAGVLSGAVYGYNKSRDLSKQK